MSKKHTQNIIAESRKTLPITIIYGVGIWLLAGLVNHGWWIQFMCFVASVYTMIQLNNINLMIRIYSRSVSAAYILLSCIAVWLFPSLHGAVIQLGTTLILLLLFACYQDTQARGKTFYPPNLPLSLSQSLNRFSRASMISRCCRVMSL